MADDDKTATVREMKARFDENNAKLRNVRRLGCGAGGRTGRPWRAVLPCSGTGCKLQLCEGSHHHQRMRSAACAAAHVPPTRPPARPPAVQLESQRRTSEGGLRRAAFTAAQLDEMPDDVATYRAVGKA